VTQPEGRLESSIEIDERAKNYYARIRSTLDVNVARAFVASTEQHGFDLAQFTEPPQINVEVQGHAADWNRLGVNGRVALTNFTFRGQSASGFQSEIEFTNFVLTLHEPRIQRGNGEHISAAIASVDFNAQKIYITNGLGTANPLEVARAIGPIAGAWFEPYHFLDTPTSRVNGSIAFDIDDGVDLHFDFEGGRFEWWMFKLPRIAGQVNWVNDSLTLKDIRADFMKARRRARRSLLFLAAGRASA